MKEVEAIRLYCGVSERKWNHHPVGCGEYACVSPVNGRKVKAATNAGVPAGTKVIQDSGAFSDSTFARLSFAEALIRQETHAIKRGYESQISHVATYDVLIDEIWSEEGGRKKERWSLQDAEDAVSETVEAARWLNRHRNGAGLVVSAQGVTNNQYLKCTERLMPFMQDGDLFGMGGWCIVGMRAKSMMPIFQQTAQSLIPFLQKEGVKRIHIWGVIFPKALGVLLWHCDQHGIALSTDNSGVSIYPAMGRWGYGDWQDKSYSRPAPEVRGLERARHVECTRNWLANFRSTQYYKEHYL